MNQTKTLTLALAMAALNVTAQTPPPAWFTNFYHFEVRTASDGVNFTNVPIVNGGPLASNGENDSTNQPWANGFNHIPFNPLFFNSTGYPTNKIVWYWSWNVDRFSSNNFTYNGVTYNMQTNWLQATNDPGDTGGTLINWSPYPPVFPGLSHRRYIDFYTTNDVSLYKFNTNTFARSSLGVTAYTVETTGSGYPNQYNIGATNCHETVRDYYYNSGLLYYSTTNKVR